MKKSSSKNTNNSSNTNTTNSVSRSDSDTLMMDMPNFEDDQTMDSLDFMTAHLRSTLNSSLRDNDNAMSSVLEGAGSWYDDGDDDNNDHRNHHHHANGNGNHNGSVASSSRTGSEGSSSNGSGGRGRGGGRGGRSNHNNESSSSRNRNTLSSTSGSRRTSNIRADHVDLPHLDDILRASAGSSSSADAAGGHSGMGGSHRGMRMDQSVDGSTSRNNNSGRGAHGHKHHGGGVDKASSAIIIEDEESANGSSTSSRKNINTPPPRRQASLDDHDSRERGRRGSSSTSRFENLWGGVGGDNNLHAHTHLDDSSFNENNNNRPATLFKTISGRAAFMSMSMRSNGSDGGSVSVAPPPPHSYYSKSSGGGGRGHGGGGSYNNNCVNSCQAFVRSHAKLTIVCMVVSVGLAATMGALVVMIPLWMKGEERGESGELGGLAYGHLGEEGIAGNGEAGIVGTSLGGGEVVTEPAPADGTVVPGDNNNDSNSNPPAQTSSSSPVTPEGYKLKPPPYNLQVLCSSSATSSSSRGYEKCISACLPSQCCLVPENKPYEVWKLIGSAAIGGSGTITNSLSAISNSPSPNSYTQEIGSTIHSCFHEYSDMCVHYYNQCTSLGTSVLLPRKPPTDDEVGGMKEGEKLELAEWINHSCNKLRNTDTSGGEDSECAALCHEKECCFEEDEVDVDEQAVEEMEEEVPPPALMNGNSRGSAIEQDTLIANGFVEVNSIPGEDDMLLIDDPSQNEVSTTYDNGDGNNEPTMTPTTQIGSMGIATNMPTPDGSSYKPTPAGSVLRERRSLLLEPQQQSQQMQQQTTTEKKTQQTQHRPRPLQEKVTSFKESGLRRRQIRRLVTNNDPQLGHMEIPGEEDFVYIIQGSEDGMGGAGVWGVGTDNNHGQGASTTYPGAGAPSGEGSTALAGLSPEEFLARENAKLNKEEEDPSTTLQSSASGTTSSNKEKNCLKDPKKHCVTYAGCAPLFLK